ncbi:MAG: cell division protein FtsZ [Alphaproteobacteria bacterium]|nr:cell division protein FtsZ [Alphaproteobacteria bacterium]MBV9016684.1 cell division protein FtsZ [Alphaproteobacteria bacterium]MBV9584913.1 cell division protein FtsZ [Alphaproteobacteria bacterium]MBV9964521.1 cell division protein FtsZ [Alphaproteobacteria bacterium]
MINLSIPKDEHELKPRITVIGIGGAGGNAVNNMIRSNLIGCEFVVCNTDAQSLQQSTAPRKIQLGVGVTRGLGAGARPDVGRAAAEEALDEILDAVNGSNMVFLTAGMGGGTGTGAAPVIARVARESGILTVGVVTKPFHFEGVHRMRIADSGIEELQKFVDTLIIIPNQNLFRIANERTTFADAFKMADDVLHSGVRGVTDLMVMPGLINLDFADIRTVMSEMGKAMMGTGEAEGERRAIDAAEAAISNPLLEDVSMKGARGVLINITGGTDMTLFEVDEAANRIREEVDPDANIIFGSTFDEKLAGRMRISVVATGIDAEAAQMALPSLVSAMRPVVADAKLRETAGYTQPMLTQNAAAPKPEPQPPRSEPRPESAPEPVPAAVAAAESAALRNGAFVAPRPVEAAPARPVPISQPAVPPASDAVPPRAKGRVPSLIERMTGVARHRAAASTPARKPQAVLPAARPTAPPRLTPLEREERPGANTEDDLLDIPAFLRRQAN